VVYLDIDAEAGLRRKQQHAVDDASQWNRMEQETLAYHQRVRAGYLEMAAAEPGRWLLVDAGQAVDAVQAVVQARVGALLRLSHGAGTRHSGTHKSAR
jgi:dTMP kinase